MRVVLALLAFTVSALAQANRPVAAPAPLTEGGNLPVQRIGIDDLVGVQVYDSPELTRTIRVGKDGTVRMPMLKRKIKAAGLYPQDVETSIVDALKEEQILVDPVVTVSVVEYRSRPISIVGAVKRPLTFQSIGHITLLDAISRAEGLAEDSGPEILISRQQPGPDGRPTTLVQRVAVKTLIDAADPEANIRLDGGEEIRVPEAGRVWIMGSVKKPGAFPIKDAADTSVMKMLAMAEGTGQYFSPVAYIYRKEGATGGKNEIAIDIKKILERRSPDVTLLPNDVLYIPENYKRKGVMNALEKSLPAAAAISGALIYALAIR